MTISYLSQLSVQGFFVPQPAVVSSTALQWSGTDTTGQLGSTQGGTNNQWTNLNSSSYANTRAELPSSGNYYYEVVCDGNGADDNASIGLMSMNGNNTLVSAHWDSSNCTHKLIRRLNTSGSQFQESDSGDGTVTGDNTTSHNNVSWSADPRIFMLCWRGAEKLAWMGMEGTWINNTTPSTSSSTGAQNWSAVTGGRVGIAASTYVLNASFIIRAPANHSYSAPSGFTAAGI